jgi:hypothetical protein
MKVKWLEHYLENIQAYPSTSRSHSALLLLQHETFIVRTIMPGDWNLDWITYLHEIRLSAYVHQLYVWPCLDSCFHSVRSGTIITASTLLLVDKKKVFLKGIAFQSLWVLLMQLHCHHLSFSVNASLIVSAQTKLDNNRVQEMFLGHSTDLSIRYPFLCELRTYMQLLSATFHGAWRSSFVPPCP